MRRWLYQFGGFSSGLILFIMVGIGVVQANEFPFKIKGNEASFYGRLIKRLAAEGFDLKRLEANYGTSKEVVVAILLVESSFGKRPGRYGLVSVFSSLSMQAWPDVARPCKTWLKGRYPHLKDSYLEKRLKAKSQWAFKELVYLLRLEEKAAVVDVLKMKGSWAGAFGICQFLPSSLLRYGADGDGDGKMRLEEPYDAMASVANYLKSTRWKEGLSKRKKEKVLLKYNYSDLYVGTILKIKKRLGKST